VLFEVVIQGSEYAVSEMHGDSVARPPWASIKEIRICLDPSMVACEWLTGGDESKI